MWLELILRMGSAVMAGFLIGINRAVRGKSAGVRTHGVVALASCFLIVVMSWSHGDSGDLSRVIQGVVTGIGFLGAGVIMRDQAEHHIEGLTTAASIWLTAAMGLACGFGLYHIVLLALGFAFVVLIIGGPIENICRKWFD